MCKICMILYHLMTFQRNKTYEKIKSLTDLPFRDKRQKHCRIFFLHNIISYAVQLSNNMTTMNLLLVEILKFLLPKKNPLYISYLPSLQWKCYFCKETFIWVTNILLQRYFTIKGSESMSLKTNFSLGKVIRGFNPLL